MALQQAVQAARTLAEAPRDLVVDAAVAMRDGRLVEHPKGGEVVD